MDTKQFLQSVITTEEGYFCLAFGGNGHGWVEEFYSWPTDIDKILERAQELSQKTNVYFSTYLFSEKRSLKQYVLPSKTIQADLDEANIGDITLPPSILVLTSDGRHQGYWILKDENPLDPEIHEIISKKLTYSISLCDHSGWPLGRKVRLPGTKNYKYLEGPQDVEVIKWDLKKYSVSDLELLPEVTIVETTQHGEDYIDSVPDLKDIEAEVGIGPQELLESIKNKIPPKVYVAYNIVEKDRSAALWALMCSAFRAGLDRNQVYFLAWNSANNKFKDLHHNAGRELAKDIVRAEIESKNVAKDVRQIIADIRKLKATRAEKNQYSFNVVLAQMRGEGEFIRTAEEENWYIRRDLGRPIYISRRSDYLDSLLYVQYGINGADEEYRYVNFGLHNWCNSLPISGTTAVLSHFDDDMLLVHTGKKDVVRITKDSIDRTVDGSYNVVFRWMSGVEPFNPILDTEEDWGEILFGDAVSGVIGLTEEQAKCLLKTWIMFLLFRDAAVSKPILALFGQPGSGKTTLWRRIYRWIYGEGREINAVTRPEDFDQAMKTHPLVVFDNVDTWEKWLPDRIATSAGNSDIARRKLYTDADDYIIHRQAMLGLSAHNPKFGREDITDRLLLINFERLRYWKPEGDILKVIVNKRNHIWGSILKDAQKVLRTPIPDYREAPQFRVEDFARIGYWIATALGYAELFSNALAKVRMSQKSFNLDEDYLLVDAIGKFVSKSEHKGKFLTPGQLWQLLETYASDPAFVRIYRNSATLSKKMWALQDSLKEVFSCDWELDKSTGLRKWRLDEL